MSSSTHQLFMGIVSVLKLKEKSNDNKWRNFMLRFCEMNRYWRFMLGKISKSTPPSKVDANLKKAYEEKPMKGFLIINLLCGAIWTTCIIHPMSHMKTLKLAFEIEKKFKILYRHIRFIERNAIFIRFFTWTMSDFANSAQFADYINKTRSTYEKSVWKIW